jgi:phosphoserine phosphatase RsbU/P
MKRIEVNPPSPPPRAMNNETFQSDPAWIKFNPAWGSAPVTAYTPGGDKTAAIVIADDDPVSRELLSTLVTKWGFRTIVTQDGHEAMAAIRAEPGPVVAIIDWMMPGMDGLEVCRRVRQSGKLAHIILLTVRAAKENLVEGLESGADDYLVKPFDKNELLARVKVGVRVLGLETSLRNRVKELESALSEIHDLKLQVPL